ncbi:caspase family protein [Streptomyces sp. NPDC018972]|uniref:caspase family protein n=1 Tax=Streptomyces sp. NPDC018972 TaxID=3365060 RepID=UPI0037950428
MRRRALLIGCQTGGLTGVHADVELMGDVLAPFGFEITPLTGERATRHGIENAYRRLIADSRPGDAALVYYSGHGGRARNPAPAGDPSVPAWLPYLCPQDLGGTGFRGLLAASLSRYQEQLTRRTANVTTVLDCCFSGRMARGRSLPKAHPRPGGTPWEEVRGAWEAERAASGGVGAPAADANPLAVRLVACAPDQSAYETDVPGLGRHGVLTASLARLLRRPGSSRLTWRQLIGQLRPAVAHLEPFQRPDVEGPADRFLFDVRETSGSGVLPVLAAGHGVFIDAAELFMVEEGDVYALVGPGGEVRAPFATAVVERVTGGLARLRPVAGAPAFPPLPEGTEAHPLRVSLGRRAVAVVPAGHPDRERTARALMDSAPVRIVRAEEPVMATVVLSEDGIGLLDELGEPLLDRPRARTAEALELTGADLRRFARAAQVRELASGTGPAALDGGLDLGCARLLPNGSERPLERSGEHLFRGDQVVVRIRNRGTARRFVSVFDIGLRGTISLLTTSERSGVGVGPGECYELYRHPRTHELAGVTLFWPDGLPEGSPRPGTFLAVVTDRPQDLSRLAQEGVRHTPEARDSSLQRLLGDLLNGVRDGHAPAWADGRDQVVRYRVERFEAYLHPERRADPRF